MMTTTTPMPRAEAEPLEARAPSAIAILLLKGLLLLAVVVTAHVLIFSTKRESEKQVLWELNAARTIAGKKPDILYFGDSSIAGADMPENHVATSAFLQEMLPAQKVEVLAYPAYHMGIYEAYLNYLGELAFRPKAVIIPVNLRSFSPSWDRRPEYQFSEQTFLMMHPNLVFRALFGPLRILKTFSTSSTDRDAFLATPVFNGPVQVMTMEEFNKVEYDHPNEERTRNIIILHYMYELTPEHRRIRQMARIAASLRDRGIDPIFYVTPIDYQTCSRSLGPGFETQVARNVDVIRSVLAENGGELVDLSHLLDTDLFNWHPDRYPNEHYQEEGRRRIARAIADVVRHRTPNGKP